MGTFKLAFDQRVRTKKTFILFYKKKELVNIYKRDERAEEASFSVESPKFSERSIKSDSKQAIMANSNLPRRIIKVRVLRSLAKLSSDLNFSRFRFFVNLESEEQATHRVVAHRNWENF